MHSTTLCFLLKGQPAYSILLGLKKQGFGQGKYNGFGGKIDEGETVRQAALRELREECGVTAEEGMLDKVGELEFVFPVQPDLNHDVHIFCLRSWQGEPIETEEMKPVWFAVNNIPYEEMWQDDIFWLPKVLAGEKVKGKVIFGDNNEDVREVSVQRVFAF